MIKKETEKNLPTFEIYSLNVKTGEVIFDEPFFATNSLKEFLECVEWNGVSLKGIFINGYRPDSWDQVETDRINELLNL